MKFKFKLKREDTLFSEHAIKRLIQRNIERDKVEKTILSSEIIEKFIF